VPQSVTSSLDDLREVAHDALPDGRSWSRARAAVSLHA